MRGAASPNRSETKRCEIPIETAASLGSGSGATYRTGFTIEQTARLAAAPLKFSALERETMENANTDGIAYK